ncbi:MAG: NAD-dependent epimerase/dehydratase family protein [Candidatus Moduliflexus flocculans]|nr:NAD-dependent epimerase/dehydratase family protein [Candidatus Moduliflexus flocculans]
MTGSAGFIGARVVDSLLRRGFENIRCFVRPGSENPLLKAVLKEHPGNRCEVFQGNLLSREDCAKAAAGVSVVYHLVAGRGKSFPGCFQGSVVTTRNLLDAVVAGKALKRFVNVSSFIIYSNRRLAQGAVWDESCPLEDDLEKRFDAYLYGKFKQDEIVRAYQEKHGLPYTIICPGIVFGPGRKALPGSLGLDTFGIFMRVGGAGRMPLTYVDNCADAIVLAGLVPGVEGEVFNVTDDDLPKSRSFLRQYKRRVERFRSRLDTLSARLRPLLALGALRGLVQGTAAPGVQPPQLRLLLEGAPLCQSEAQGPPRLGMPGAHEGRPGPLFQVSKR